MFPLNAYSVVQSSLMLFAHSLKKLLLPYSSKRKSALKSDQLSVKKELRFDLYCISWEGSIFVALETRRCFAY